MDSYSKCPFQYRYLLVSFYVCFLLAVSGFIFRPLIHLELARSFMCGHLVLSVSFADDVISSLASASDVFVKYKMTVVICTCLVLWFCFTDPCVCFFLLRLYCFCYICLCNRSKNSEWCTLKVVLDYGFFRGSKWTGEEVIFSPISVKNEIRILIWITLTV